MGLVQQLNYSNTVPHFYSQTSYVMYVKKAVLQLVILHVINILFTYIWYL